MAERQYVGARYVPKFYQNSQNPLSNEWEGNVAYEALTTVTYNNSSYTSKIPVPAGIGNPASNPTYWVVTGNYNAQVEEYRQEVVDTNGTVKQVQEQTNEIQSNLTEEISNREKIDTEQSQAINTIRTSFNKVRKFIIIGDSYSELRDDSNKQILDYIIECTGFNRDNITYTTAGGRGFTTTLSNPANFETMLTNALTGVTASEITDIVVIGGANDVNATPNQLSASIESFCNTAKTNCPNATIWIGCCGRRTDNFDSFNNMVNNIIPGYMKCQNYGGIYIDNIQYCLHSLSMQAADGIHPAGEGAKLIGTCVGTKLLGGNFHMIQSEPMALTPGTLFSSIEGTVMTSINDNLVQAGEPNLGSIVLAFNETQTTVPDAFKIASFTGGFIYGGSVRNLYANAKTVAGYNSTDGTTYYETVNITPVGKELQLDRLSFNHQLSNIRTVTVRPFMFCCDAMSC